MKRKYRTKPDFITSLIRQTQTFSFYQKAVANQVSERNKVEKECVKEARQANLRELHAELPGIS